MSNMRIIQLQKLRINCSDVSKMSDGEYAFICIMALAIDEISCLKRLMLQALRNPPRDPVLHELQMLQAHTVSRLLSAKIIEAQKLVVGFEGRLRTGGDPYGAAAIIKPYIEDMVRLRRNPLFKLTGRIRAKLANHYDLAVAQQLTEGEDRPQVSAVLHRMEGNSYFLFGEQALFGNLVNRFFEDNYGRKMIGGDLNDWHDYELEWCRVLTDFFYEYLFWLRDSRFPHWKLTPWRPYLEPAFVGDLEGSTLPIFLDSQKN